MTSNESSETSELIASALRLPMSDRVALVNAMLASREDADEQGLQSEIDKSWGDEIARRIKEIETGQISTIASSDLWERIGGIFRSVQDSDTRSFRRF